MYRLLIFAAAYVAFISCKEDEETNCKSDFSSLRLKPFAYSNDQGVIAGKKFCSTDIIDIFVDDTKVEITDRTDTTINFTIPMHHESSAVIRIALQDKEYTFATPMRIYPASGDWKEVAPFPGNGRGATFTFTRGNSAYILGGVTFQRINPGEQPVEIYHGDIYAFNEESMSWSLVGSHEEFKHLHAMAAASDNCYVKTWEDDEFVHNYNYVQNSFGSQGYVNVLFAPMQGFSIGGVGYYLYFRNEDMQFYRLGSTIQGQLVKQVPCDPTNPQFAFEHNGKAYFGTHITNMAYVDIWSFDPAANEVKKLKKVDTSGWWSRSLKFLFKIDELAYFIEKGEGVSGETMTEVRPPADKIYIYNITFDDWRIVDNVLPELDFLPTSFSANNRGFAGMGLSDGGDDFSYSTKMWEFIPK
jgi:hypothetical protein